MAPPSPTCMARPQDVMEEWAICQKSWLYLEPIFSSDDIMRQLPVEGKRYQTMDRTWRKIMLAAKQDPKVGGARRVSLGARSDGTYIHCKLVASSPPAFFSFFSPTYQYCRLITSSILCLP